MRYAVIPEIPEDQDLRPLAVVVCRAMGLPEAEAHPSSIDRIATIVADIYEAVFNAYGVPSP
jgi:hypothetical protein